jgi:chorismate mutase/prephenate dehydratase
LKGIIRNHLDTLVQSDTKVCGELYLPISFCLMSNSTAANIKKVYSHAQGNSDFFLKALKKNQGLEQCRRWLRIHFPDAELVPAPSTAKAAEMAASEEGTAAVSNKICASIYKLKVSNFENDSCSFFRF